jgi:NAD(P)-dependent dehydrogenase (short-subunit alcohol dehydrogenase family)
MLKPPSFGVDGQRGPCHILVNNAGMNRPKPLTQLADEDTDVVRDLKIEAVFHVSRVVAKGLLERSEEIMGAIVFKAREAPSLVTGSALMRDGGWTAA